MRAQPSRADSIVLFVCLFVLVIVLLFIRAGMHRRSVGASISVHPMTIQFHREIVEHSVGVTIVGDDSRKDGVSLRLAILMGYFFYLYTILRFLFVFDRRPQTVHALNSDG